MSNSDFRSRKEHGLKRFISEVAIFFLLLIAGAYTIDAFITENLKKIRWGDSGIWNEIFAGGIKSEIVVYGASRAWAHYDSRIMEDSLGMTVYNLGIDGHNFWLQYLRHSMLLKYNTKPKVIVLDLSTNTLAKRKDLYGPEQFLPYMRNQPQVESTISSYDGYKYLDFHIPLLRYYGKAESLARSLILFLLPSHKKPDRIKGYLGMDLAWNSEDWERTKRSSQPSNTVNDPQTVKLFDSFLEECKVLDIKVIFVVSPEFIEGQSYVTNRKEIFSTFDSMSTKYNIPFFDYSKESISYESEYFYNATHMNKNGAELFTKRFVADLKPLLTTDGV
jgi:hypothetical protein